MKMKRLNNDVSLSFLFKVSCFVHSGNNLLAFFANLVWRNAKYKEVAKRPTRLECTLTHAHSATKVQGWRSSAAARQLHLWEKRGEGMVNGIGYFGKGWNRCLGNKPSAVKVSKSGRISRVSPVENQFFSLKPGQVWRTVTVFNW